MVITCLKEAYGVEGKLMVVCEEVIIQMMERYTGLNTSDQEFRNTETCLILTASKSLGGSKKKNNTIHYQGLNAFSVDLEKDPVIDNGISTGRAEDSMLSAGSLLKKINDCALTAARARVPFWLEVTDGN